MPSRIRAPVHALARAILAVAIGLPLIAAPAAAEDVVVLKPQGAGGQPTRIPGEIVDYTGRELLLRNSAKRERSIPSERVERVETAYGAEQLSGDESFARGDFRQALQHYRAALSATREPRDWVRRQVLSQIVRCQRNLNQPDQAGEYFLILLSRDPDTQYFDCIPLEWTPEVPPPAAAQKALDWLGESGRPAAVLMGASLLLATDKRDAALDHLKRLAVEADPRIAWLAQAQLFRLAAPGATLEQLLAWSEKIESSPLSLRAGAYFLLGSALVERNPEGAALALLKLPILYPREYRLSAAALLAAGGCLEKLDRAAQAAGLYRELAGRYEQAPEAKEAQRRLRRLASGEPAREN